MRDWKAIVRAHLDPLPVDPARAADIVDELAQHVADHYAELRASGMADDEARAAALAPLRDRERLVRDISRSDRPRPAAAVPPPTEGAGWLRDALRDSRYSLRLLARSPAFTVVAVLTLTIGIGVNTAIFSVIHAVLLRPMPYADPNRLGLIGG